MESLVTSGAGEAGELSLVMVVILPPPNLMFSLILPMAGDDSRDSAESCCEHLQYKDDSTLNDSKSILKC